VLGIEVAFEDPGIAVFGLCNAVMPVGNTFLEVVSPVREGTTAGRHLERQGGDSGYMVIVQTPSLERDRARVEELGVRVVWQHAEKHTSTIHLHPRDVGAAILSLDQSDPWDSWDWAGPDWETAVCTDSVAAIAGVELRSEAPEARAKRWGDVLDVAPKAIGAGRFALSFAGSGVRVAAGSPEGVAGFDLVAVEPDAVRERARARGLEVGPDGAFEIGGARIRLVDAWRTD
jgi:hypothetical protein